MPELQVPLLVVGSHSPKDGVGCVMNLMNWEQGRYRRTLFGRIIDSNPRQCKDSADGFHDHVRSTLIMLNDSTCHQTKNIAKVKGLRLRTYTQLCPICSSTLIEIAHMMDRSALLPSGPLESIVNRLQMAIVTSPCQLTSAKTQRARAIDRARFSYEALCKKHNVPTNSQDKAQSFDAYRLMQTAGK